MLVSPGDECARGEPIGMGGDMQGVTGVWAEDPLRHDEARALAAALKLPLLNALPAAGLVLVYTTARLELRRRGPEAPGPVYVDFLGGAVGHRHRHGGGRGQAIAKAIGIKPGVMLTVVDATAGLGRDAFVLAALGCEVRLIERSPVVAALLRDGLTRATVDPVAGPVVARMWLLEGDAATRLALLTEADRPDVVYVDPMHPERKKSALTKKEMRLFRALVGEDADASSLLAAALAAARKRVVVKRPRLAERIPGPAPSLSLEGRSTRFDVYLRG